MEESELIFTFFYILLCACIIYPPQEFVSLGLSIDQIFSNYLGSEQAQFVRYHQKLTATTLAIHGSMPMLYFIINFLRFPQIDESSSTNNITKFNSFFWKIAQNISILVALLIAALITYWYQNSWKYHPISKALMKFSNSNNYESVAINIADEFRRPEILNMKINSISSVIATENWIIKTTPYFVYFGHQSDTSLVVNKTESFNIAQDSSDLLQMVDIDVTPSRQGVKKFKIRINALEFKTLQDRISRPIMIPPSIKFHQNLTDRFIDVFKEYISNNKKYKTNQTLETCFGCMTAVPNVKINKQCLDIDSNDQPLLHDRRCQECYCQPMWCVDCLVRWFVSRQNEYERDVWLEKKCTCPLCRAKFCILDVSYLDVTNVS